MPKKKTTSQKKRLERKRILFYVVLPLLCLIAVIFAVTKTYLFTSDARAGRVIVLYPNPEVARPNLQLQTFPFITLPPTADDAPNPDITRGPAPTIDPNAEYCPLDDVKPNQNSCACLDNNAIACPVPPEEVPQYGIPNCVYPKIAMQLPPASKIWYCVEIGGPGLLEPNPPAPPNGCFAACIAKPIVYLYPPEKTSVDVIVSAPGEIFISDPDYPVGGWKDVIAYPDGQLEYKGNTYSELFYETNVTKQISMPEKGFVIARDALEPSLRNYVTKIGLQGREVNDFLAYWVPTLEGLNSPYIFFSILPHDVKESVDHLTIVPEPDTRIEFIAYFKPLTEEIAIPALELPKTPPSREGFTEVEWGGTIAE